MRPRLAVLAASLIVALTASACGSGAMSTGPSHSSPRSTAAAAPGHVTRVTVSNFAFHPQTIVVSPGTKLIFTNRDQTAHTATSTTSAFDTGSIAPGASRTVTINRPGTYAFYCQFHAFMRGTIVVK